MYLIKLFGVLVVELLLLEFSKQECQRREESITKHVEASYDYDHRYRRYREGYNEVIIQSEEYICENAVFPLEKLGEHCDNNCSSKLIISSMLDSTLPPLSFSQSHFFTVISMNDVKLQKISPAAFNSLTSLTELYISKNLITGLPDGLISSLNELQILDISSNRIENITQHTFIGLGNLKALNLSGNHIKKFDTNFLYNTERIQIDLSFNMLEHFNFENVSKKIHNLNLSHNAITKIVLCSVSVEILDLQHNRIEKIQNCGIYSEICELDLGYNSISELSLDVFNSISSLKRLFLNNNNISSLQADTFSSLVNLTNLNLSSNHLKHISYGTFEHFPLLQYLDLSDNDLTDVKRYLHSLINLRNLDLCSNHIHSLDSSQLISDLPKLNTICLNGNNLSCEELIEVYQNLLKKEIKLRNGPTKSTENIQGIACEVSNKESVPISKDKALASSKLEYILKKYDATETSMYKFFTTGFKDSDFYKYLQSLNRENPVGLNQTELVRYFNTGFKNATFFKFLDDFNQSLSLESKIIDQFKSNLEKYFEKSKEIEHSLQDNFKESTLYNFFNDDFQKSQFYQYFQDIFQESKMNFTPTLAVKSPQAEKLINNEENVTLKDKYYSLLLVMIALLTILIFVVCILIFVTVKVYFRFSKTDFKTKEHLELIQS